MCVCAWLRSCVAVVRAIVCLSSLCVCRVRFARVSCPWLRFERTCGYGPLRGRYHSIVVSS